MKRILLGLAVLLSLVMLSCAQSQSPSGPSSGPANKAIVEREIEFWQPVFVDCCGVQEQVMLKGTAKAVFNENGRHFLMKDLVGICMYGGHTYTTQGSSVGNVRDTETDFQVTFNVKLINEEGCRSTVKMHFKYEIDEETGEYTLVYDHSEVICEPGDET